MNLFEIKDYQLHYREETLMLKPFKALWDRDKSKQKLTAIGELCFVYYFADGRSDFNNILDEDIRTREIIDQIGGLPDNWKPDAKIQAAIDFYVERTKTVSSVLLEDAEYTANKLGKFLRGLDLDERDANGKYINDPSKVSSTLEKIPKIIDTLQETAKKVKKELQEKGNARGSVEKGTFEDGI